MFFGNPAAKIHAKTLQNNYLHADLYRCSVPSTMGYPNELARRLAEARKQRGWSRTELAKRADKFALRLGTRVSQPDISRTERGNTTEPGARKLLAIARALGLSISYFTLALEAPEIRLAIETSLRNFLDSPLADGVTPEEEDLLRAYHPHFGKPSVLTWVHVLGEIRSSKQINESGD